MRAARLHPRVQRILGFGALAGSSVLGYALLEARLPVLRRREVPILAPGQMPLTILHLSDLHLTAHTAARVKWVRNLANLHPDLVVNTGDNLSFASGMEALEAALQPLLAFPGAFVLGDHDYHTTRFKLPTRYLRADPRRADQGAPTAPPLDWQRIRAVQSRGGWIDLTNTRARLQVRGQEIALVGVDDPHAQRDLYPPAEQLAAGVSAANSAGVAGKQNQPRAPLRLGLTHAPYRRILQAMSAKGVDLVFAGHTHGGQLCLPGYGTLVTNCDLDRGRARGLSTYPRPGTDTNPMYLHVSAGLGTSPYTPVRLACRPEATLLTLTPRQ